MLRISAMIQKTNIIVFDFDSRRAFVACAKGMNNHVGVFCFGGLKRVPTNHLIDGWGRKPEAGDIAALVTANGWE